MKLSVLGARGSMPVSGGAFVLFGGASSCYMLRAGDQTLFLDAGSGLAAAPTDFPRLPHILLSHLHLDHVLGLGMYPRLLQAGRETVIHVPVPPGEAPSAALSKLYAPPFWPLRLDAYTGAVRFEPLHFPLSLGPLLVEGIPGHHPGGCWLMRVSCGEKSLVYATDYEYEEGSFARLAELSRGAELILFDGQYSEAELAGRKGFGHSCPEAGLELLRRSGAKRLLLVHHDPQRTDAELLAREAALGAPNAAFARQGEEITL